MSRSCFGLSLPARSVNRRQDGGDLDRGLPDQRVVGLLPVLVEVEVSAGSDDVRVQREEL